MSGWLLLVAVVSQLLGAWDVAQPAYYGAAGMFATRLFDGAGQRLRRPRERGSRWILAGWWTAAGLALAATLPVIYYDGSKPAGLAVVVGLVLLFLAFMTPARLEAQRVRANRAATAR
ncbi:hypothetical protein [Paractinoplanes atraurantiacus]|nr:hypothetical protein [Actinoplanes atraurantiacus]